MKAALTGQSGFIGTHLSRCMREKNWEVCAVRRDHTYQDMLDMFQSFKPDVVVHLASFFVAEHKEHDIDPLIQSNLLFGCRLLEAMRVCGVKKIINTGTSWQHTGVEHNEPACLYAATKTAFESLVQYYVSACAFQAMHLKIFDTYGPHDTRPKLIPSLVRTIQNNLSIDMSEGEQHLNLVHVNDIAKAYMHACMMLLENAQKDGSVSHYVLSGKETVSLRTLVEIMGTVSGKNVDVRWGKRPYRAREIMQPWPLGVRLPGWMPSVSLEKGLEELFHA